MYFNKYYNYDNIELWDESRWEECRSGFNNLCLFLQENHKLTRPIPEPDVKPGEKPVVNQQILTAESDDYLDMWSKKGIHISCHYTRHWIAAIPKNASGRLPVLMIHHPVDEYDTWWPRKIVEYYRDYVEDAAETQGYIVLFLPTRTTLDDINGVLIEALAIYPVDMEKLYFDVSPVLELGKKLSEVPAFTYTDREGNEIDPDESIEYMTKYNVPVLDFSMRWPKRTSTNIESVWNNYRNSYTARGRGIPFDVDALIHSGFGRKISEALYLEHSCSSAEDEIWQKFWRGRGIEPIIHDDEDNRWLAMVPKCALEDKETKLPLLCVFKASGAFNPDLLVTASGFFHEYCDIAAQGQCIVILYAREDANDNDYLVEIIKKAAELYPVDLGRVYLTGHSHNGDYTLEFCGRHPGLLAGIATLGDPYYINERVSRTIVTEDKIERMSQVDTPVIDIGGACEGFCIIPEDEEGFRKFAEAWQRRLKASRCPMKSVEEIKAAQQSNDTVSRRLGVPFDSSMVLWADGFEQYIGDVLNNEGKAHLRIMMTENTPHTTSPFMMQMAWSFLRRFKRDLTTGEIIDLF